MDSKEIMSGLYVTIRHKHPEWTINVDEKKVWGDILPTIGIDVELRINNEPQSVEEFNQPYCFDVEISNNGASVCQGFECSKIGFNQTFEDIIEMIEEVVDDIHNEGDIWPHMIMEV